MFQVERDSFFYVGVKSKGRRSGREGKYRKSNKKL